MAVQIGDRIAHGQFTVLDIKEGGFARVLIVEEGGKIQRAIKCIREEKWQRVNAANRQEAVKQFLEECLVWQSRLNECPYTAKAVFAFPDFYNLGPALLLEVIQGPSLGELREAQRRLSMSQTIRVGSQIAQAMRFAHDKGVVHRDLKPSNVLLTRANEARVIDWGLCSVRSAAGYDALSEGYVSPQREANPELVDPQDDVFAFGVILYECLTGNLPQRASWADEEVGNRLRAAVRFVPEVLVQRIEACLKPDPSDRPPFGHIVDDLQEPSLLADAKKRERELPFCRSEKCQFVSVNRVAKCPVCGQPLWVRVARKPLPGMIRIPAGEFTHGLTANDVKAAFTAAGETSVAQEQIQQLVGKGQSKQFLPAYDIDEYPVTNKQFERFCKATNYPAPSNFAGRSAVIPDHPVVDVTWKDALCYALKMGKRLPSPLEWERAARGDRDARVYPWGHVWDPTRCNTARNQMDTQTTPITAFTEGVGDGRSPHRVADLVGNVREWVSHGTKQGTRGLRGGSWSELCILEGLVSYQVEASVGSDDKIGFHDPCTGFRCAADIVYDMRLVAEDEGGAADGQ